jgi:DNA-binding protein H-NS
MSTDRNEAINEVKVENVDLQNLDLDELKKLQKDVDKAIREYETRRRQEAVAAADAAARERGFSLSDLVGTASKSKAKAPINPPKYRHPENPELTWTGRGRKPKWITQALAEGKSVEDFAI